MEFDSRIVELVKQLKPIDDIMFRKMAEDIPFCEELLRTILDEPRLRVLETIPQHSGTNLQGRGVVLDARCELSDGRLVDIEVQQANDDNHQKRVRYNGAVLTTNITETGTKFEAVPDVCVVFIARFDIFRRGRAVYHVSRVVDETGEKVYNGFTEVYVNACARDDTNVSRLMRLFLDTGTYSAEFPETSRLKRQYTVTEDGQKNMCEIAEKIKGFGRAEGRAEGRMEGRAEGRMEGRAEGISNTRYEIAQRLLDNKLDVEFVIQMSGLTREQVEQIVQGQQLQH